MQDSKRDPPAPDDALATEPGRRDCLLRLLADFPERHASVDAWAQATHGLGAAELLALVFSVCVLGNDWAETVARMRRAATAR